MTTPAPDDEDSLFGSPPPSPARGRSPSPQLALPTTGSSSVAADSEKHNNVGTIALPGSQSYSELASTPAALLLSSQPTASSTWTAPAHRPIPPPLNKSRPVNNNTQKSKKDKGKARASRSSTPRPPPPEIPLPNPDEPPPPNFLRNSQALLGLAGLVAGVKPSQLSKRHRERDQDRGATPDHPIVVEEYDPPPIGQRSFVLQPESLPEPPSEEIVASLVKQQNIFPVLESLLRMLSHGNTLPPPPPPPPSAFFARPYPPPPPSSAFHPDNINNGPALKRRKLNRVPAGAADWDVPYPFADGEGPEEYRAKWEKNRLRQLLSQLVGLVRGATRSAATRTFFRERMQAWYAMGSRASNVPSMHAGMSPVARMLARTQPPHTTKQVPALQPQAREGPANVMNVGNGSSVADTPQATTPASEPPTPRSVAPQPEPVPSNPTTSEQNLDQKAFDDFMQSLMASAPPDMSSAPAPDPALAFPTDDAPATNDDPTTSTSTSFDDMDFSASLDPDLEAFISMLQDDTFSFDPNSSTNTNPDVQSPPTDVPVPMDVDQQPSATTPASASASAPTPASAPAPAPAPATTPAHGQSNSSASGPAPSNDFDDIMSMIDPFLLAISQPGSNHGLGFSSPNPNPNTSNAQGQSQNAMPPTQSQSQSQSPMASTISLPDSMDPETPRWDELMSGVESEIQIVRGEGFGQFSQLGERAITENREGGASSSSSSQQQQPQASSQVQTQPPAPIPAPPAGSSQPQPYPQHPAPYFFPGPGSPYSPSPSSMSMSMPPTPAPYPYAYAYPYPHPSQHAYAYAYPHPPPGLTSTSLLATVLDPRHQPQYPPLYAQHPDIPGQHSPASTSSASLTTQSAHSSNVNGVRNVAQSAPSTGPNAIPSTTAAKSAGAKSKKEDIIKRAKERRKELERELERAKVELWEVTIEQGVLAHLVKEEGKAKVGGVR